jgi:hypothetical protein
MARTRLHLKGPLQEASGEPDVGSASLVALDAWTRLLARANSGAPDAFSELHGDPGQILRDLVLTWGFQRPNRISEQLERAFTTLAQDGLKPVIHNLHSKVVGRTPLMLTDATHLVAAIVHTWPKEGPLEDLRSARLARAFALRFMREFMLATAPTKSAEELQRAYDRALTANDTSELDRLVIYLREGAAADAHALILEASGHPGALIIAAAKNIFIGSDPSTDIRDFVDLCATFADPSGKGLLIIVMDGDLFGEESHLTIYHLSLLGAAITRYALMQRDSWDGWLRFRNRCCLVLRDFAAISSKSTELAKGSAIDVLVQEELHVKEFDVLPDAAPTSEFSFGPNEVLRNDYPSWVDHSYAKSQSHHWDVVLTEGETGAPTKVRYFIVPRQQVGKLGERDKDKHRRLVASEVAHLIESAKPSSAADREAYDAAQEAIYWAARGRLGLDRDHETRQRNLMAAAELRRMGFEIFPIEVALALIWPSFALGRKSTGRRPTARATRSGPSIKER